MGRRVVPDGLWVSWEPLRSGGVRRRRKGAAGSCALVLDLSISGARVAARSDGVLAAGSVVAIGLEGRSGQVRVRWAAPEQDGRVIYGVEFVYLDERLRRCFHSVVHGDDRALEARWHHTR